ncbi:MAG: N-acetylneuraminate synthase family protein [Eubacterium sp.]|nr:N-acetylneuraminate synthase family protein [Eubacterium sp.]
MALYDKPLFIFEMANNHQGSVEHGKNIIKAMAEAVSDYRDAFDFAVKFQYRDLDTFIRPDYINRDDIKNVKRFKDTRLSQEEFLELKNTVSDSGMYTMCTGFDEKSVERISEQGYDVIKIASCSFNDWPLLEAVSKTGLPVIASTAGVPVEEIDKVVSFFEHRNISLTLMHCVAEYPTSNENLQMNQIDYLRDRYKGHIVGFSTHEDPSNMEPIKIAVAKNVRVFEKHVGLPTDTITLNLYSANPDQVKEWVKTAYETFKMCGLAGERHKSTEKEQSDLSALQRGVFAGKDIAEGTELQSDDVFFAFPCEKEQLLTRNMSKYSEITLKNPKKAGEPIYLSDIFVVNNQGYIAELVKKVMKILKKSNVTIPLDSKCEISHHYGVERFEEVGVTLIDCINREYCKKILVVLPGQKHPVHLHKEKEETFTILYGSLDINCDGIVSHMQRGQTMTVQRNVKHSFSSEEGCVFEEVSTTHYINDSFYDEHDEFVSPRKTKIYITAEMIENMDI